MAHKISHPARCVVWTDASAPIAPSLARVLTSRGLEPTHAASPHTALAELCLDQHAGRRPVLILDSVPDPARLLAAVERFAPDAVVWIFDPGANPPLRPVVLPNAGQRSQIEIKPTPVPMPVPAARNGTHPTPPTPSGRLVLPQPLRLTQESQPNPEPQPQPTAATPPIQPPSPPRQHPISARDVLDDAELEMLLAGERAMDDKRR